MLALARSLRNFEGTSKLSTYLYAVARNFCLKKRRTSKFAPKTFVSTTGQSLDDYDVQTAIQELEPAYKEVLVLRDIEGLSAADVAQVVGVTVPAVKSRLHRARAQLRSAINRGPNPAWLSRVFSVFLEDDLSPTLCATMQNMSKRIHCAESARGSNISFTFAINRSTPTRCASEECDRRCSNRIIKSTQKRHPSILEPTFDVCGRSSDYPSAI